MEQFKGLGLSEAMIATLARKGFTEPTPVQREIIPFLMNKESDVVAQAATGTGKTAAFGIPIIEKLDSHDRNVKALVLVPTRELALQVAGELGTLNTGRKLEILPAYGGQGMGLQLKSLKQGVDIVVGTPGRILDHLKRGSLRLDSLSFLVLDEADQMLDMGFIEDIEAIISHAPAQRRTLLFSATMPRQVIGIAKRFMRNYETVSIAKKPEAKNLTDQIFYEVREQDKFEALCRIIDLEPEFYGLVFCRTRIETAEIAEKLVSRGYAADGIHGEIDQYGREKIMRAFRDKNIKILAATDVAARGIDVDHLTHVINYTIPQDTDAYTHRIGRTGRAGRKGIAVTLVTPKEGRMLDIIRKSSGSALRKGSIPKVKEIIAAKRAHIRAQIEQTMAGDDFGEYSVLAAELLTAGDIKTVLAACLQHAFSGKLEASTYGEIFPVKSDVQSQQTRLFVARGRRHGITPRKLAKFISQTTGLKEKLVRDIEIRDDFAFVSIPSAEATRIQNQLKGKGGRPLISKARPDQERRAAG